MIISLPTSAAAVPTNPMTPAMQSDARSKPDRTGAAVSGAATHGGGDEKQYSLQEMLDQFKAKIEPWMKIIVDYGKKQEAAKNMALDLEAGQAALEKYLAGHPGRQGSIDFSHISVTLPESSSLRTGGATRISLKDLLTHYKNAQPEFKLPDLPTTDRELKSYRQALQAALDVAQLPLPKDETLDATAAAVMRKDLLDAMKRITDKYGDLLLAMLRR